MTLAYGIALWMDWDKPMWAGFAVAVTSLGTIGQSINKGALRIGGTFAGVAVALLLLALFPQDRWLFALGLSLHVGFCTYMMGGREGQYFWTVAGFVAPIIALEAGPTSAASFDIAVVRAQQTAIGVLAVVLMAIVVWPRSSGAAFTHVVRELARADHALFDVYSARFLGDDDGADLVARRKALAPLRERAAGLVEAAETDTYAVWEARRAWQAYRRAFGMLGSALERWRQSFTDTAAMDVRRLLPDVDAFLGEIGWRLATIDGMHHGRGPEREPASHPLHVDSAAARALTRFEQTALEVARGRLVELDRVSRSMFEASRAIYDGAPTPSVADDHFDAQESAFPPDPDRLFAALRVIVMVWLAWMMFVFVPDLPGGVALVVTTAAFAMPLAISPQIQITSLLVPTAFGFFLSGCVYMLVMPALTSFWQLAIVIFVATFSAPLLFPAPQQFLSQMMYLAFFLIGISVENSQTYSFTIWADKGLMIIFMFALLTLGAYIPRSTMPDVHVAHLLERFKNSADYLLASLHREGERPLSAWHQAWRNHHLRQIRATPRQLRSWLPVLRSEALLPTDRPGFAAMIETLADLGLRLADLVEIRAKAQATPLVRRPADDIRASRRALQTKLAHFGAGSMQDAAEAGPAMTELTLRVDRAIEAFLRAPAASQVGAEERANMYRVLGAYRGVVGAVDTLTHQASAVDWQRLREARF